MCLCVYMRVCGGWGLALVTNRPNGRMIGQGSGHLVGGSQTSELVGLFSLAGKFPKEKIL